MSKKTGAAGRKTSPVAIIATAIILVRERPFTSMRAAQIDLIAVDQLHRIEFQGYFASNSQESFALNTNDGAAGHGSGRNHGEASDTHIAHDDKVQVVSCAAHGQRKRFRPSEA